MTESGQHDRRAMVALAGITVLSLIWFAGRTALGLGPHLAVDTLLMVGNHALAAVIGRRIADSPALAPAARRFWRSISLALGVISVALILRLPAGVGLPGTATAGEMLHAAGGLLICWALARLPLGAARGTRIALALDLTISMIAVATLILHLDGWHPMTGSALGTASDGDLGRPILVAALPVAGFAVALGTRRHLADALLGRVAIARRRSYSLVPCLAVAVVDGLLIESIVTDHPDRLLIAVFAVLLTGLVVLRQLLSVRENERLIGRLDEGLDDLRDAQERLSHEASHDALTGLANRTLFGDRVGACLGGLGDDRACSVVLIDLDDFKTVNDTLGHAAGDALLAAVADRLRAVVRPSDTVARLGGDEFAILFDGVGEEHVDRVLQRIAESLLIPVPVEDHLLSVRASFGVAEGHAGDEAGELMRRADVAMYEAKHRGQGGHQRYAAGMESRGAERGRRTAALRSALENNEFELFYQPQVALPGGDLVGAEALIRWRHPTRGLLGPAEFIEDAEESGLIVPIGAWVLAEACRQAAEWRSTPGAPATMSVNVSAHQLQEPGLAVTVAEALTAAYLPADALTVEITESAAVGGGATRQNLQDLRELGVRIALDDFGTGASSLSLLHVCPVDEVKLDRSFVPGASFIPGTEDDAIARAVLQLAHAFGLSTVAEGVETAEQAAYLAELGYHSAQGYYYARPMPAAEVLIPAS